MAEIIKLIINKYILEIRNKMKSSARENSGQLFVTSGTFPASPGSFFKINIIIHELSNVVKISSNIKK